MMYMPRPALRFPRAVDVPSALSIMREDRRDLMLDVLRKLCRSAQHTLGQDSQALHDHLYVNWLRFCVTACNPVWYMHALK